MYNKLGFENTSEFSRRYQSTQNCICDTEHMFNCPSQSSNSDDSHSSPSFKEAIRAANEEVCFQLRYLLIHWSYISFKSKSYKDKVIELSLLYFQGFLSDLDNPYLTGEKLHVAAKKGLGY